MNSVREEWTYLGFAPSHAAMILEAMIQRLFAKTLKQSPPPSDTQGLEYDELDTSWFLYDLLVLLARAWRCK
jgi:hypothetical protein